MSKAIVHSYKPNNAKGAALLEFDETARLRPKRVYIEEFAGYIYGNKQPFMVFKIHIQ